MATYSTHKKWLEAACGPADGAVPQFDDVAAFQARNTALDRTLGGLDKDAIRKGLRQIKLKGSEKIDIPFLAAPGDAARPMDVELDARGDKASSLDSISTSKETVSLKSPKAAEAIRDIQALLEPVFEKSRTLAGELDADGNRLFSDRDIEKELWSPLVREGVIPSNVVPDAFSETAQVFRQGAAVYEELMAREDGRAMSPDGVATALRVARHVVKVGKLVGSEALRYVDVSIQEASRQDFAKFAAAKVGLPTDDAALEDIEKAADIEGMSEVEIMAAGQIDPPPTPEKLDAFRTSQYEQVFAGRDDVDIDQLRGQGKDLIKLENIGSTGAGGSGFDAQLEKFQAEGKSGMRPLDMVRDDFCTQAAGDGGNTDYAAWLGAEESRLADAIKCADPDQQAALTDRLNAIQGAKLTHEFADHLQHQAALTIASTVADSTLKSIEQARDKRQRRDAIETVLTGAVDVVAKSFVLGQDTDSLTLDSDTLQLQHNLKYGASAAKGAIRGINKLSQAIVQPGPPDAAERRAAIFAAVAEFLNAAGEGVALGGQKSGGRMDVDGDGDGRDDAATYALIGKSAAIATRATERIIKAIERRDPGAVLAEIALMTAAAPATKFAGDIGDVTRKDSELGDIRVGLGTDGLNEAEGVYRATNPFEEVRGAAGQTDFGMSGDLATVADQRSALEETDDLLAELEDSSKAAQAAPKITSRLRAAQTAGAGLPGFDGGDTLRALLLIEDPQELMARADDIREVLAGIAQANAQAEDDALIGLLSDDVDKARMSDEMDSLRALIEDPDDMDAGEALDHFKAIRDEMLKDERVLNSFQDDLEREDAELAALKERADLTRLDTFTDPEEYARERDAALDAIQDLTQALKAAEKKAKMIDTAIKAGLGIVLAAVPGAGLAQKIRLLIADLIKAQKRASDLLLWKNQMEAMAGNYSVYEYAASGEKQVLAAGTAHDVAEVVADAAGVAAETLRLIDHTHLGAAGLTTVEKSIRCLNEIWFVEYSEARIRNGWKAFKDALRDPEDRRKARAAMELNTTFGKCVLAYGACIDQNAQARAAMQACGLTPEVLASRRDVCQAVVDYLRTRLDDGEFETIADHDSGDWLPCEVNLTLRNWTLIKAAALKLSPALDKSTYPSPDLDRALAAFEADGNEDNAKTLNAAIAAYGPKDADAKPHLRLTIVLKAMGLALRRHLPDPPPRAQAEDTGMRSATSSEDEESTASDDTDAPVQQTDKTAPPDAEQIEEYRKQVLAAKLLERNNCLINAITDAAQNARATIDQLIEIRSTLGNVGQMMAATPTTIPLIKRVLKITSPIKVYYRDDGIDPELFAGAGGKTIRITHNGADHFVPGKKLHARSK